MCRLYTKLPIDKFLNYDKQTTFSQRLLHRFALKLCYILLQFVTIALHSLFGEEGWFF